MQDRFVVYAFTAAILPAIATSALTDLGEAVLEHFGCWPAGDGYYLIGAIAFVTLWAALFGTLVYIDPRKPDRPGRGDGFDVLPPRDHP